MTDPSEDVTALWAEAVRKFHDKDFPVYGSDAWRALPSDSPKRIAAALEAAELYRRLQVEQARLDALDDHDWYAAVFADARATASRLAHSLGRVRAVRNERMQFGPVHQLRATPGWPPIRIPGGGGRYLTYTEGRAAA